MKAIILGGGRGERLRPLTDDRPKPMLDIWGKPLLEHLLHWLKRYGLSEAILCLGYRHEQVRRYFGDGDKWGMALSYSIEEEPLGTAGAVKRLEGVLDEDFLIVYGDLYIDMDLQALLKFHASHPHAATLVVRPSEHPYDSDLAVLDKDNRVTALPGKPKPGQDFENLACAAVWVLRRAIFQHIPEKGPSDFGRDIFPRMLKNHVPIMGYRTSELLFDIGTGERYREINLQKPKFDL